MTRTIETPAARASDPHTSHAAADAMTASGWRRHHQDIVTAAVRLSPGSTSAELSAVCERRSLTVARIVYDKTWPNRDEEASVRLDRWQIARRLPEAETAEDIRRGEARKCSIKERKSLTWWPVVKGAHA
ncbi:MarR family transcriptional regulator [Salinisphaera sp. T31B1]|uniref:MarR family transcriptional regulator n=1 Tax=Salinisphaera sp. T31B1 TaxID=727963 RepID=UPI00333FE9BF